MIKENKTTIQINLTVVCSLLAGLTMFFVGHWVGYDRAAHQQNQMTYRLRLGAHVIATLNPDGSVLCDQSINESPTKISNVWTKWP